MKKIFSIALLLLLCVSLVIPSAASPDLVVDDANLLSDAEESSLRSKLSEITERLKCTVAVVTVNDLDGKTARAFADDYYDYNGYGCGEGYDGVLLLISMSDRDWYITTCGLCIDAISDYDRERLSDEFLGYLSSGAYAEAFNIFADGCDELITDALDTTHYPLSFAWIPISLVVGFIIALISVGSMKRKLTTVQLGTEANNYVREGSMSMKTVKDIFLYRNVSKTAKPKETSSSGSSTHVSSSGRTHGGGGGKF